jgi:hypothetical protein
MQNQTWCARFGLRNPSGASKIFFLPRPSYHLLLTPSFLTTADSTFEVHEVVAPGVSSLDDQLVNNPFRAFWMPYMITSPALFYATLFTASVHRDALFGIRNHPASISLKIQTINLINDDLQKSISDGTIATSMVIMHTEVR